MRRAAVALALSLTFGIAAPSQAVDAHSAAQVAPEQRAFALCVAHRESHSNPRAIGEHGSHRGKWQFGNEWRHGLPFMVAARLVAFGMPFREAHAIRVHLSRLPINRWPEWLQDVGFLAALNARGPLSGAFHWHIRGSKCNALAGMR